MKAQEYQVQHRVKPEIRQLAVDSETVQDELRIIHIKADTADIEDKAPVQIDIMKQDEVLQSVSAAVMSNELPVKDIILQDEQGGVLEKTAADDHAVLTVASGAYTRVKASVTPSNASAKVVVIEKAGGDLDAVQLAYDGYIKGVQPGTTLLKAIVVTRDAAGNKTGTIEKYFSVEVQ